MEPSVRMQAELIPARSGRGGRRPAAGTTVTDFARWALPAEQGSAFELEIIKVTE